MTDDEKIAAVRDHLAKLGQLQPAEIARLFADLGIQGHRMVSTACPVAQYVRAETGTLISIRGSHWITGTISTAQLYRTGDTPETVGQFIGNFDAGIYPRLVQP